MLKARNNGFNTTSYFSANRVTTAAENSSREYRVATAEENS